jgi:ASC-1-like (ASCH) protein
MIDALNISLVFYKSFHKIKEKIQMEVVDLDTNSIPKGLNIVEIVY